MSVGEVPSPGPLPHQQTTSSYCDSWNSFNFREAADEVDITMASCHHIFTEKFQIRRVSAKFVQRLLTDYQKDSRVEISQEVLANANGNKHFLKDTLTGDVKWVCECDVETKIQLSQWKGKGSPLLKEAQMSRSKVKVMLVVFLTGKACPS